MFAIACIALKLSGAEYLSQKLPQNPAWPRVKSDGRKREGKLKCGREAKAKRRDGRWGEEMAGSPSSQEC